MPRRGRKPKPKTFCSICNYPVLTSWYNNPDGHTTSKVHMNFEQKRIWDDYLFYN